MFLVVNSKALTKLDATNIQDTLNKTLTYEYGQQIHTTIIDTTQKDVHAINNTKIYTENPAPVNSHTITRILDTKPHNREWNPQEFVYTYGSQIKSFPILRARVVNPRTNTTTHTEIKSLLE